MMTCSLKTTYPHIRPRRLRSHPILREMVKETLLTQNDFILPLFIKGEHGEKKLIPSMPGHYQIPLSCLEREIYELINLGVKGVILFGVPFYKDGSGSDACHSEGIIQKAVRKIKSFSDDLLVICDLCFCEYTDHGHCGILSDKNKYDRLDNDLTLDKLCEQALYLARAGADVIAPSGMIDGSCYALREMLDREGFEATAILSYSVKYNSALYGPFRMAAEGAPQFGTRQSHQMDCANKKEGLKEASIDEKEGADILMVKPAHTYLDVIHAISSQTNLPIAAYHTSGEYMMIKAAASQGLLDEKAAALEVLTAIKRAGARLIISYYTKELLLKRWLG